MSAAYGIRLLGTVEKPADAGAFRGTDRAALASQDQAQRLKLTVSVFTLGELPAGLRSEEFSNLSHEARRSNSPRDG